MAYIDRIKLPINGTDTTLNLVDGTISSWARAATKPSYDARDIDFGALDPSGPLGSASNVDEALDAANDALKNVSDTKVTNTLATTTKYYVTGTTSSTTNTGTQSFDSGIYSTTTAGQLNATTYKVNEKVTLQWNATTSSLDFIFS